MDFSTLPHKPTIQVEPWECHIPEEDAETLKTLLRHSPKRRQTFENSGKDEKFGVKLKWMEESVQYWFKQHEWCVVCSFVQSSPCESTVKATFDNMGDD